jgi:hypothetical protein
MKLRDEDKIWLSEEIAAQLKKAIDSPRPHGWRQAAYWLRQLGPIAATIAIIVTLFGITLSAVYYSVANVKEDTRFRTTTEDAIKHIREDISVMRGELVKQSMIDHASLPLSDFKATLPDLGSAIASARQKKVKVPPKVIDDLQQKLIAAKDAPGFWPTAAEFINYRSESLINDVQSLMRSDLPNCTDHEPTPMELVVNGEDEKRWKRGELRELPETSSAAGATRLIAARYEDCRFTLDSPQEAAKIPFVEAQRAFKLTFKHCQIIYRGGPIRLLSPNPKLNALTSKGGTRSDVYILKGQTVHFENCLFLFVINSKPPDEGQRLTEQLLAQSGPDLTVTAPKSATHS